MSLYLKQLHLKNYCGYSDHTFNFTRPDGTPYPYVCFFGPNGIGKSSILNAISMLTMSSTGRGIQAFKQSLSKYVQGYNPYQAMLNNNETDSPKMLIEGVFDLDGKDYTIQLTEHGWLRNDLFPVSDDPEDKEIIQTGPWKDDHLRYRHRVCHFTRSDSDLSLNRFQLISEYKEEFEDIINKITGYPTCCITPQQKSDVSYGVNIEDGKYCTDLMFTKKDLDIHFHNMSDGEKKICKSFSELLNLMYSLSHPEPGDPAMEGWPRLLLIDNIVMHVYYKRHIEMVDCLKKIFHQQQIFATTHSGVLIPRFLRKQHDKKTELMIDLELINS